MEYRIDYSKKRKSITLTITPKGEVLVKAPNSISRKYIEELLSQKKTWIDKKISYYTKLAKTKPSTYTNGDTYYLFGQGYTLALVESTTTSIDVLGNKLIVKTRTVDDYLSVKNCVVDFYLQTANSYLAQRAHELFSIFNLYNLSEPRIHIVKMRGKWGVCTASNIIKLNRDLVKVPKDCSDYVIFHELCHLIEKNHKQSFYKLLSRHVANWKELRNRLNDYGVFVLD